MSFSFTKMDSTWILVQMRIYLHQKTLHFIYQNLWQNILHIFGIMKMPMTVRKNPAITYPVITNPAEIIPSEMNLALSESRQNWISPYLNLPKTESRLIWISPKLNPAYYEFRQKSNPPKFYYIYRPLGTRKWHQNSNWTRNETFLLVKYIDF